VTNVMDRCNAIVVGASADGVSSLMQLVTGLPRTRNAAVAVALDVPEESIPSRQGPLKATHAADGEGDARIVGIGGRTPRKVHQQALGTT
jgi:hypothetical protein